MIPRPLRKLAAAAISLASVGLWVLVAGLLEGRGWRKREGWGA
jgi:hypothetical protein